MIAHKEKITPVGCKHPCFCSGACMGMDTSLKSWVYVTNPNAIDSSIVCVDGIYYQVIKEEEKDKTE